jgi:hypothetical protein
VVEGWCVYPFFRLPTLLLSPFVRLVADSLALAALPLHVEQLPTSPARRSASTRKRSSPTTTIRSREEVLVVACSAVFVRSFHFSVALRRLLVVLVTSSSCRSPFVRVPEDGGERVKTMLCGSLLLDTKEGRERGSAQSRRETCSCTARCTPSGPHLFPSSQNSLTSLFFP